MAQPYGPTTGAVPWWVLTISGVAAIAFGVAALLWPDITLFILILLFGVQALIAGVIYAVGMFKAIGEHRTWWTYLILAIVSIGAGLFVLAYPGVTALTLLYIIAFWAIIAGTMEIVAAFTTGQFLLFIVGLFSIVVGFLLVAYPGTGALAYVMLIGLFAIVRGVLLLVQAIRQPSMPAAS